MLADARHGRNEAQQREQQEFERAERVITSFALASYDSIDPPRRTGKTRRCFDWADVRRAYKATTDFSNRFDGFAAGAAEDAFMYNRRAYK